MEADDLIHALTSFGRTSLREVIKLGAYTGSDGGLSVILFTLAVLTILCGGLTPTPTSVPIPF
jgi:hypothetical protein